jgi:hypothetical protein
LDILGRSPGIIPFATVAASQLTVASADGAAPRFAVGSIEYRGDDRRQTGARLFWGPYIALPAGVYVARIMGRLEGSLVVEITRDQGNAIIGTATLLDFDDYFCFVLTAPAEDIEIRGIKTGALRGFSLDIIELYQAYVAPHADRLG